MLRRYKEIIFGLLLGAAMWVVDAAMHVHLGTDVHAEANFAAELFQPGATQFVFRSLFLVVAALFGWALWRANWRERELEALERAVIAFHRQLDAPALRIVARIRMLQGRAGVARDAVAAEMTQAIGDDARHIDELAKQYLRFSEQVMAGRTGEAVETLRAIETWAGGAGNSTSSPSR